MFGRIARPCGALALALAMMLSVLTIVPAVAQDGAPSSVRPPASVEQPATSPGLGRERPGGPPLLRESPVEGQVPGSTLGGSSDADLWRDIRAGRQGTVASPDQLSGVLIQSEGQTWREVHMQTVPLYGAWAMLGMIVLLALVFAIIGRVRIEHGRAGVTITRFPMLQRAGHWLTAVSFIVLALTGLNILYGRGVVLPVIGPGAFSAITLWGKYLHNYVAFAFMAGLIFIFIAWVAHNIPRWADLVWLAKGGGIIVKGVYAPAYKFNAGQKIIFWLTILGGLSISLSGWALLFPFTTEFFTATMEGGQAIGVNAYEWFGLPPPPYSPILEQQLNQVWHSIVALFLVTLIIAHIYIGTVGMEGAFEAMGSGEVDLNWAREHHDHWVAQEERKLGRTAEPVGGRPQPAE
ncbi:MAG TPA: formate dehydrogenase subunit gamma [Afifellaceae bacterium]|nr:formate dehydrogenase subunit gamma [Afifellaceae bacterium]